MQGITKAKRNVVKPLIESSVDSFLWRLANKNNSGLIALAILSAAFLAGTVLGVLA